MVNKTPISLDLLAFGAHPDDVEIGMGGTLCLYARKGYKVGIVDLTKAELSSNGTVERRQKEAREATKAIGLAYRECLDFPDRGLMQDPQAVINTIVDIIRSTKPKLVFAPFEQDRHPDHGHCGTLVKEAVFSAGVEKYKGNKGCSRHRADDLYFYFINGFHKPDFLVDITSVQEEKMKALKSYRSQFVIEEGGIETPLTNGYIETVESRDRLFGKEGGLTFAEGFRTSKPLVVKSLL
ncbi:bacillithiol biosynthesis deacetylase BshB1 [Pullulanibacillus sp. KACC 23026]|uniref:bacillithiol biosynthesis deacetylase BshB1 n=1 Tax=Pullulanibacillus sp. KACC 23026 TaxID=3028315 RepID=UPI0023AE6D19|nr:bacillithiol biosynthesis deacetylase BshB1 [Pullulanibacillus sp. KACC 23026]WEG11340.1 bacillithiol biosynthesis deacetylase BshB1 [Pullulanibacillus sp. KACC 23026]